MRVIACLPVKVKTRTLVWIGPLLLGTVLLTGCDENSYPENLTYPVRTDPLVVDKPKEDAKALDKPGEFPSVLFANLADEERNKLLRAFDPAKLTAEQHQALEKTLTAMFGTPAQPKVDGVNQALKDTMTGVRTALKLDPEMLAQGSRIYRHQCLHCHGLTGDGRGPTAPWVNPHPRDYRQGRFKFTSSSQAEGERKPRREDLRRTIYEGIEGTSMPAFRLLPDDDLEAVISYVIHLSLRGETEFYTIQTLVTDGGNAEKIAEEGAEVFAARWQAAENSLIQPGPYTLKTDEEYQASVRRGLELFSKQGDAGCISCHIDFGRQSAYKYDDWGTIVRPIDLTTGIYRGGRRPVDLYWRIHSGIAGTGMTAFGSNLNPEQIWDLVNFLQVLPYPPMREKYGFNLEAK
jgi:mono/diheme cytochrome c family protein